MHEQYINAIAAGSISGYCSVIICHPIDNIRTRIQADSNHISITQRVQQICAREGFRGFYKGFWPPFLGQGVYKAIIFSTNQYVAEQLFNNKKSFSSLFTCGCIAGAVNSFVVCPVELIRNRKIVDRRTHATLHAPDVVRDMIRSRNVLGLWRGLTLTLLRDGPGVGLYFLSYEMMKQAFPEPMRGVFWSNLLSGCMAGVAYWAWALPLDTLKTHTQVTFESSHDYSLRTMFRQYCSVRGINRLFYAWPVAFGRGVPGAAVTLATYDAAYSYISNKA